MSICISFLYCDPNRSFLNFFLFTMYRNPLLSRSNFFWCEHLHMFYYGFWNVNVPQEVSLLLSYNDLCWCIKEVNISDFASMRHLKKILFASLSLNQPFNQVPLGKKWNCASNNKQLNLLQRRQVGNQTTIKGGGSKQVNFIDPWRVLAVFCKFPNQHKVSFIFLVGGRFFKILIFLYLTSFKFSIFNVNRLLKHCWKITHAVFFKICKGFFQELVVLTQILFDLWPMKTFSLAYMSRIVTNLFICKWQQKTLRNVTHRKRKKFKWNNFINHVTREFCHSNGISLTNKCTL